MTATYFLIYDLESVGLRPIIHFFIRVFGKTANSRPLTRLNFPHSPGSDQRLVILLTHQIGA